MKSGTYNLSLNCMSPSNWLRLEGPRGTSYADSHMLLNEDGTPVTGLSFCDSHLTLQRLGVRSVDDMELNILLSNHPTFQKQLEKTSVWTGFLRNIRKESGGFSADYIARPEIVRSGHGYRVVGSEKRIHLPQDGYFKVSHVLETEDGLPRETFKDRLEEPSYLFLPSTATEDHQAILRGGFGIYECFGLNSCSDPFFQRSDTGIIAASDRDYNVKPEDMRAVLDRLEALRRLDCLEQTYVTGLEEMDRIRAILDKVHSGQIDNE